VGAAVPLLLLPGTLCDARVWAPVREALGEGACGFHAAALEGHRSMAAMAAALLAAMPPRCAIAGFSLGGIAANARPDPPENAAHRRAAVARARQVGLDRHVRDDLLGRYFGSAHADDPALRDLVCRMAEDAGVETYAEQSEMAIHRADGRPRLPRIAVPTLVVGGGEDAINPADRQEEMARALPQCLWHQVPGAGHFVPLEAPAELAALMGSWLGRVASQA
jgi:pimeloyl-ACP methyl ester carboxylesterase